MSFLCPASHCDCDWHAAFPPAGGLRHHEQRLIRSFSSVQRCRYGVASRIPRFRRVTLFASPVGVDPIPATPSLPQPMTPASFLRDKLATMKLTTSAHRFSRVLKCRDHVVGRVGSGLRSFVGFSSGKIADFLVATKRLYKSVCPSIRWSVLMFSSFHFSAHDRIFL